MCFAMCDEVLVLCVLYISDTKSMRARHSVDIVLKKMLEDMHMVHT